MAAFLSQNGARIAAAGIVYDVDGFKASAVRSIITAINIVSRSKFPNKVFSKVDETTSWLMTTLGAPPSKADRLLQECEERRARLAS